MSSLPQHIAIIPDGDRRWAKGRGVDWTAGYVAGMEALEGIVEHALSTGVPYVSFWILSHDNAQRSPEWQMVFFNLLGKYLRVKCEEMFAKGIGVKILGDWDTLAVPPSCHPREGEDPFQGGTVDPRLREDDTLINDVRWINANSPTNPALTVVFLLRYSGSRDIQQAIQKAVDNNDNPKNYPNYLQTRMAGIPDPELVIRTSGEQRLSDYMLLQSAHSEFYFPSKLWPDFTPEDFDAALNWYANVDRRFGK